MTDVRLDIGLKLNDSELKSETEKLKRQFKGLKFSVNPGLDAVARDDIGFAIRKAIKEGGELGEDELVKIVRRISSQKLKYKVEFEPDKDSLQALNERIEKATIKVAEAARKAEDAPSSKQAKFRGKLNKRILQLSSLLAQRAVEVERLNKSSKDLFNAEVKAAADLQFKNIEKVDDAYAQLQFGLIDATKALEKLRKIDFDIGQVGQKLAPSTDDEGERVDEAATVLAQQRLSETRDLIRAIQLSKSLEEQAANSKKASTQLEDIRSRLQRDTVTLQGAIGEIDRQILSGKKDLSQGVVAEARQLKESLQSLQQSTKFQKNVSQEKKRQAAQSNQQINTEKEIANLTEIRRKILAGEITISQALTSLNKIVQNETRDVAAATKAEAQALRDSVSNIFQAQRFQKIVAEERKKQGDRQKTITKGLERDAKVNEQLTNINNQRLAGARSVTSALIAVDGLILNNRKQISGQTLERLKAEREFLGLLLEADETQKRVNKSNDEYLRALQRRNNAQQAILTEELKTLGATKKSAARARENTRNAVKQVAGEQAGSIQLSSKDDVRRFSANLDTTELKTFANELIGIKDSGARARKNLNILEKGAVAFRNRLTGVNGAVNEGSAALIRFGAEAAASARRLALWAVPSAIIFSTISRLKASVDEIVELDRQARRLIFFSGAQGLFDPKPVSDVGNAAKDAQEPTRTLAESTERASEALQRYGITAERVGQQIQDIIKVSEETGIALRDVTEAFVTITRVGQETFSGDGTLSRFAEATLSLVRLEAGALGATEAVRGLQAIQAQFFGGIRGRVFSSFLSDLGSAAVAAEATSSAVALLAATSANSTASASELIDATTRLGAAFTNIQGLNFAQTVGILGEAFTATGATTGRIATALRQTATLISQNAAEIEKVTGLSAQGGIEIVQGGQLRDFSAILDVLERIRDVAGTVEATELSLLIADRRNLADVQALAANVDNLREKYETLGDFTTRVEKTQEAIAAQFKQNQGLSESLAAGLERINTAFVKLTDSDGFRDLFAEITNGVTKVLQFADGIAEAVANSAGLSAIFDGAVGVGFALAAAAVIQISRGFLSAIVNTKAFNVAVAEGVGLLRTQETTVQGLDALVQKGVLREDQRRAVLKQLVAVRFEENLILNQIEANQKEIAAISEQTIVDEQRRNRLLQEQKGLRDQLIAAQNAEAAIIDKTSAQAQAAGAARAKQQAALVGGLAAGLGVAAATEGPLREFGGTAGKIVAGGVTTGLQTGLTAAAIGGGPIGTIAAVIAGALTGAILESSKATLAATEAAVAKEQKEGGNINAVISQLNASQESITKLKREASAEDRAQLKIVTAAAQRNKQIAIQLLQARQTNGELTEEEKLRLELARATIGAANEEIAAIQKRTNEAKTSANILESIRRIQAENAQLARVIADESSTEAEVINAKNKLQENQNRLKSDAYETALKEFDIQGRITDALIRRESALRRINDLAANRQTVNDIVGQLADITGDNELKFEINQKEILANIGDIQKRVDVLRRQAQEDPQTAEENRREIASLQKQETSERKKLLDNQIKRQSEVIDKAKKAANEQVKAWEKASSSVTKAFESIVGEQAALAGIFQSIGEQNLGFIKSAGERASKILEDTGASIETRLTSLIRSSANQLAQVNRTFSQQLSTVTGSFQSTGDISAAVDKLIESIARNTADADKEIVDKRTGEINRELAANRAAFQQQQALFKLNISETRRAVDIRKQLLQGEINIFKTRLENEKRINEIRRSQLAEFGALLLDSPEQFKQASDNIKAATSFFSGITSANRESLTKIADRVQKLRESGQEETLKQVIDGIRSSAQFGTGDVISGIANKQLEQIFSSLQIAGVEEVAQILDEQRTEAQRQTELDKEIRNRQEELLKLGQFEAQLQRELLRLANARAQIDISNADTQLRKLDELSSAVTTTGRDTVEALATLIALVAGDKTAKEVTQLKGEFGASLRDFATRQAKERSRLDPTGRRVNRDTISLVADSASLSRIFSPAAEASKEAAEAEKKLNEERGKAAERYKEVAAAVSKVQQEADAFKLSLPGSDKTAGADVPATQFISKLTDQIDRFGRFLPSDRIAQIQRAAGGEGRQLTRAEQQEINRLRSRFNERGVSVNTEAGGRRAARRLLTDRATAQQTIANFRRTLSAQLKEGGPTVIQDARRLRGEGARGRRNINVDAVKEFFASSGFTGAAQEINTRGQATEALDQFIQIADRLSEERGEISRKTREEIVEVLGRELSKGFEGVREDQREAAREARANPENVDAAIEAKKLRDTQREGNKIFKELIAVLNPLNKEIKTIPEQTSKAADIAADAVAKKIAESLAVKVDPIEILSKISVEALNDFGKEAIVEGILQALSPLFERTAYLERVARQTAQTTEELARKRILRVVPPPQVGFTPDGNGGLRPR